MSESIQLNDDNQVVQNSVSALANNFLKTMQPGLTEEEVSNLITQGDLIEQGIKEAQQNEDYFTDSGSALMLKTSNLLEQVEKNGLQIQGNIKELDRLDPNRNYQRMKQIRHELAKDTSTEQAVIDSWNVFVRSKQKPKKLSIAEAHALSKEKGVELKFDRPITEGELEYNIERQLRKKEVEQDLAYFAETGDYTPMQNAILTASTISGGFGFFELAGTIGLSYFGGLGIANALSKVDKLSKGVRLAQKAALAEKLAKTYANGIGRAKDINKAKNFALKASKYTDLAQEQNFLGKLGYDAYRMGKGITGQHASTHTVAIPFAVDGALTTVPSALLKRDAAEVMHDREYGTKQVLTDIMVGGTFGGALPYAGTLIRKSPQVFNKIKESAINAYAKSNNKEINKAILKGDTLTAEELAKQGSDLDTAIKDVMEQLPTKKMNPNTEEAIVQQQGANITDDEAEMLLQLFLNQLNKDNPMAKTGSFSSLEQLPFKYKLYSSKLGMLDTMQDFANIKADYNEFFELFEFRGIPIEYTKKEIPTNILDETFDNITNGLLNTGVKIKDETGLLGRYYFKGLNTDEAKKFMYNTYLAKFADDTEHGQQAILEAEAYITKLQDTKRIIKELIDTYDKIESANEAAKAAGKKVVYSYGKGEQNIYPLADGTNGSLTDKVKELARSFLPESKYIEYEEAMALISKYEKDMALKQSTEFSVEDIEKARQSLDELSNWENRIVDALTQEKIDEKGFSYINLKTLIENSSEHTGFLKHLDEQLEALCIDNAKLLNSQNILHTMDGTPEEIMQRIMNGEDIPELGIAFNYKPATALDMHNILKDETAKLARLDNAKSELDMVLKDEAYAKTMSTIKQISEVTAKQIETGTRNAEAIHYVGHIKQTIIAADKFVTGNAGDFRNTLINKLQTNPYFQKMSTLTDLAPKTISRILNEERKTLKDLIEESLNETIFKDIKTGLIGTKLDEMLDESLDTFLEQIASDSHAGLQALTKKYNLDFSKVEDTAKELIESNKQKELYDNIMQPLIKEIGKSLVDLQTDYINMYRNYIDLVHNCLATPGKMNEIILGRLTTTIVARKGTSVNVENLSDINIDQAFFQKQLRTASNEIDDLQQWALEEENWADIQQAIFNRDRFIAGLMTDVEKVQYDSNTKAARVAQAYLDTLARIQNKLYDVGSNKEKLLQLFDNTKLRQYTEYLKNNALEGSLRKAIDEILMTSDSKLGTLKNNLLKFLPIDTDKVSIRDANAMLHMFEQLDLNKHFNRFRTLKVDLNEFRDILLQGHLPGEGSALNRLLKKYSIKDLEKASETISNGTRKLIDKLTIDNGKISANKRSQRAKYLDDMQDRLYYKSSEAMKEDLKYFGHDSLTGLFESNVGTANRAYAILKKVGSEPFLLIDSVIDSMRTYAANVAHKEGYTAKQLKTMQNSLNRDTFDRAVDYALKSLCGNFNNPASTGLRWVNLLSRAISAPMLMKAGFKSVTDINWQFEDLVTMGLRSGTDVGTQTRIIAKWANILKSKQLMQMIGMSNMLKSNIISEKLFNRPFMGYEMGADAIKGGLGKLSEYANITTKAEHIGKQFSDFMLNKLAGIGPVTDYNRTNAALNTMWSIGEFATNKWDDIAMINGGRFIQTLTRFDINQYEWNNIFSKELVTNLNDYLNKTIGDNLGDFSDMQMFIPELALDLTDDMITKFLQDQGKHISPEAVRIYKQEIIDKASLIINSSADEMTSMPSIRIQGMLTAGLDPNDWKGTWAKVAMQFQSFGAAVNMYHQGRKLASYIDPSDPLFNNILMSSSSFGDMALDTTRMLTNLAIAQFFLNEIITGISGNRQEFRNDLGEFQYDVLGVKIAQAYSAQLGLAAPLLDGVITNLSRGSGFGGGIALSVLPSVSNMARQASKVYTAATKKSTEGHRAEAIGAAMAENAVSWTGISSHPLTQAAWMYYIGDHLKEAQMGDRYQQWLRQRRRKGYAPSWVQRSNEWLEEQFTK